MSGGLYTLIVIALALSLSVVLSYDFTELPQDNNREESMFCSNLCAVQMGLAGHPKMLDCYTSCTFSKIGESDG